MAGGNWDSLQELLSLQDRMNELFEDTRKRSRVSRDPRGAGAWTPAVDIYEHEGHIVIKAELSEMRHEDIKVSVEDNHLTIHGERKPPENLKPDQFLRQERTYGTFSRSFALPDAADAQRIKADYRDGVLTIDVARREEVKPKRISVTVE